MEDFHGRLPRRKNMIVRQSGFEIVLKVFYVLSGLTVLISVSQENSIARMTGSLLGTASLVLLLISWRTRIGWLTPSYAWSVLSGLLLCLLGDWVVLEPREDNVHVMGFLFFMVAHLCFASAFWSPSVRVDALGDEGVDLSWSAPSHRSARVPFGFWAGVGVGVGVLAVLIPWGVWTGGEDARFIPGVCFLVAAALGVWRAWARVGYRSPTSAMALAAVLGEEAGEEGGGGIMGCMFGGGDAKEREGLIGRTATTYGSEGRGRGVRRKSTGRSISFGAEEQEEDLRGSKKRKQGRAPWERALSNRSRGVAESAAALGFGVSASVGSSGSGSDKSPREEDGKRSRASMDAAPALGLGSDGTGQTLLALYGMSESLESRTWQWVAAIGETLLMIAHILAALVLFWQAGTGTDELQDPDGEGATATGHFHAGLWLLYLFALCNWSGQTMLALSVPLILGPRGTLDDPYVRPRPTAGPVQSVLLVLPQTDMDAAEVVIPWFLLTARGHTVHFATASGRFTPLVDERSVTGYGPSGVGGAGPLVAAMFAKLLQDPSFQTPLKAQTVQVDTYAGLLVVGGPSTYVTSSDIHSLIRRFWSLRRPIAAIGTGTVLLAFCAAPPPSTSTSSFSPLETTSSTSSSSRSSPPSTDIPLPPSSILQGKTATAPPAHIERVRRIASCSFLTREPLPHTIVHHAIGHAGRFLSGSVTFARGTPWDDSPAFVVEDHTLLTARWAGDAFLLGRRFLTKIEEVQRGF